MFFAARSPWQRQAAQASGSLAAHGSLGVAQCVAPGAIQKLAASLHGSLRQVQRAPRYSPSALFFLVINSRLAVITNLPEEHLGYDTMDDVVPSRQRATVPKLRSLFFHQRVFQQVCSTRCEANGRVLWRAAQVARVGVSEEDRRSQVAKFTCWRSGVLNPVFLFADSDSVCTSRTNLLLPSYMSVSLSNDSWTLVGEGEGGQELLRARGWGR